MLGVGGSCITSIISSSVYVRGAKDVPLPSEAEMMLQVITLALFGALSYLTL